MKYFSDSTCIEIWISQTDSKDKINDQQNEKWSTAGLCKLQNEKLVKNGNGKSQKADK